MSDSVKSSHNSPSFQALYAGSFQQISFTGSAAQSQAFDAKTTLVKLFSTQDCWITFGTNPTAIAGTPGVKGSSILLRGGFASYFGIPEGLSYKLSVVQSGSGGTLDILEGA